MQYIFLEHPNYNYHLMTRLGIGGQVLIMYKMCLLSIALISFCGDVSAREQEQPLDWRELDGPRLSTLSCRLYQDFHNHKSRNTATIEPPQPLPYLTLLPLLRSLKASFPHPYFGMITNQPTHSFEVECDTRIVSLYIYYIYLETLYTMEMWNLFRGFKYSFFTVCVLE